MQGAVMAATVAAIVNSKKVNKKEKEKSSLGEALVETERNIWCL